MRSCPQCGRTYGDEYNFCLVDGALLSFVSDPNKTEVIKNAGRIVADSIPTVESHKSDEPPPTVKVPSSTTPEPPLPTIATFTPIPQPEESQKKERNVPLILFNIAVGVIGVIVVVALIAGIVVGVVEWGQERQVFVANNTPTQTLTPKPRATTAPSIAPTSTPTPELTPTKPIVIANPTLDPNSLPRPVFPNMEGRYYLREYQGDGTVLTALDLYDQSGAEFYVHETADDIIGAVHLDHTDKNEWVGYVVWEYSNGSKDREIIYVCENWNGFCGKLPGASWYFVATKR
jgi:hypothetical protein